MIGKRLWFVASLALLLFAGLESVPGEVTKQSELAALCEKAKAAYIFISGGSGVVIRPDGVMLTNQHVVENQKNFDVRTGAGRHFKATVLGVDAIGDLAVLQLTLKPGEQIPYLELGDSDALQIGDPALAVGNPFAIGMLDQSPTFTVGVVSALRQIQGRYTECIVTDAEINPGNSGGPLITMDGRVVGINGQINTRFGLRSNTGLGFAISARQVKIWLPLLMQAKGGVVPHGRLAGVGFQGGALDSPESVKVNDVFSGSPAQAAGFAKGDQIVSLDGYPVANAVRLASLLGVYPTGQEVAVVVRRGEKQESLKIKLSPANRAPLGIRLAPLKKEDKHASVAEVRRDSPADFGGVRPGDQLVEIEGTRLNQPPDIQHRILTAWLSRGVMVEDVVRVKVLRQGASDKPDEVALQIFVHNPGAPPPRRKPEPPRPPAEEEPAEKK